MKKTKLLEQFENYIKNSSKDANIISINLSLLEYEEYIEYYKLNNYIEEKYNGDNMLKYKNNRGGKLQVIVNYPISDNIFNDNLATFKAKLLLRSIDNLNVNDKTKAEILDKILEILDNRPNDSVI